MRGLRKSSAMYAVALALVHFTLFPVSSEAQISYASPDEIPPCSFLLLDHTTGTVLMERNADSSMPPASLAKVMTLYLILEGLQVRGIDLSEPVSVPPEGAAAAMRPGSSLMGLRAGEEVSYRDLFRGAAVASGNDAAWSLAALHTGEVDTFVELMNRKAKDWGLEDTRYVDPDGWSELAITTAYDQATVARRYISDYPEALRQFHGDPYIEWPPKSGRRKTNTNLLLGRIPGIDGLKTGTIPEAGFHFIATAERERTRFIAVVMGIQDEIMSRGVAARAEAARILLETGFDTWTTVRPPAPDLPKIRIRRGDVRDIIPVVRGDETVFTLRHSELRDLYVTVDLPEERKAPIHRYEELGRIVWWVEGRVVGEAPLTAPRDIPRLGLGAHILNLLRGRRG